MLETRQARHGQGLQKRRGICSGYSQPPIRSLLIDLMWQQELATSMSKNIFFYYCSHNYPCDEVGTTVWFDIFDCDIAKRSPETEIT